jgi:16S rRNA (cytosine967-C5)-methyltransferase
VELGSQPGEAVLDVCAAPGGKLGYLAAAMRNEGRLIAQDLTEDRLKLVRENCKRLGITCAHACLPRQWPPNIPAIFDRILIDAPCSNTGVMRRRVELRWRIKPEEVDRLRAQQRTLLNDFAPHLKKGGTLVYSTCSIEPDENQHVISDFLAQSPGWKLVKERELLPFETDTDGAYVATLQKM